MMHEIFASRVETPPQPGQLTSDCCSQPLTDYDITCSSVAIKQQARRASNHLMLFLDERVPGHRSQDETR